MDIAHIPPRVAAVIREVALEHQVPVEDLLGDRRHRRFSQARQEAMRRVRRMRWGAKWSNVPSFPQIGLWFARDHATVVHACFTAKVYPKKSVESAPKCVDPDAKRESMAA